MGVAIPNEKEHDDDRSAVLVSPKELQKLYGTSLSVHKGVSMKKATFLVLEHAMKIVQENFQEFALIRANPGHQDIRGYPTLRTL